jgi:hypothetical protein
LQGAIRNLACTDPGEPSTLVKLAFECGAMDASASRIHAKGRDHGHADGDDRAART